MATPDSIRSYENAAEITEYWLNNIAPKYFAMENINTYRAGTLGFIMDAMSTTAEDTFHGMMLARREFYPNTAKYIKSLYRHAASRFMDAPMAKPATANVLLLIQQSELLKYGVWENGLHTFVLDDTFIAHVGDIPFMLDYPVTILSVKKSNGKYAHTAHYDFYIDNTLSTSNERYLPNRVINGNGAEYLLLQARMRQVLKSYDSNLVTANTIITTVTMDFPFSGQLANFEVFYTENKNSPRVQLEKRMVDSGISKKPFCWYTIVDDETIRLQFPANPYFVPKLNSEISIEIYTTEGSNGNFDVYESDIQSENDSMRYPYNAQVPIFGVVDGKSEGGKDIGELEEFRLKVMRAYATNHTYISVHDLQLHFDQLMEGTVDRFKFTPKRDDAFVRLYGAFLLMKDDDGNVVPTNTLDVDLDPIEGFHDFDIYSKPLRRYIIRPGGLFVYRRRSTDDKISYVAQRLHGKKISDDLSMYDTDEGIWVCRNCGHEIQGSANMDAIMRGTAYFECPNCGAPKKSFSKDKFVFTNPYLISVSTDTFMAGYFLNSLVDHHDLSYTGVNDQSIVQFITRHFKIERNAISGENFYRFSVAVAPSTTINERTVLKESKEIISAKYGGFVESILHNGEYVEATIKYTYDPTNRTSEIPEDEVYHKIQISSTIEKTDDTFRVCPKCGRRITLEEYAEYEAAGFLEEPDEDGEQADMVCPDCVKMDNGAPARIESYEEKYIDYDYHPGYTLQFKVGEAVSMGDRLATAKPKDLGRIRLIMDLNGIMDKSVHRYIPLTLEKRDENVSTPYYIFAAYISTDDMIDSNHIMEIKNGFVMQDGSSTKQSLAIPIENLSMRLLAFYEYREEDDVEEARRNPTHSFAAFDYVSRFTYTNTYELQTGDSITLIKALDHARGFLDAIERDEIYKEPTDDEEPEDPSGGMGGPGFDPGNEPPSEWDERPDDPTGRYLRTVEHQRLRVIEDQDDRYPERLLVVDKYDETTRPGGSGSDPGSNGGPDDPNGSWNEGVKPPPTYDESESVMYGDTFFFRLRNTPLVSANWVKKGDNVQFLISRLNEHYQEIEDVTATLDNGFSIDIKFYNSYGKSKFYMVGNGARSNLENLDNVNITMRFGVALNYPTSIETFRDSFQRFVQKYIEATDEMVGNGIDLYVMNLIADAKAEFDEIVYMEYYGLNDYDFSAQRLTIMSDEEILKTVRSDSFVPEFLNIIREPTTDGSRPRISLTLIEGELD